MNDHKAEIFGKLVDLFSKGEFLKLLHVVSIVKDKF